MADFSKVGRVLNARGRRRIKESNFALPGRRYPIHDRSHARSALSRISQYGTPEEKAKVRAAVRSKYPGMSKQALASMRDEFEKITMHKMAADYANKVVSNSSSPSDVSKAVGGVFSGSSGTPSSQGPGSPSTGGAGNPAAPKKALNVAAIKPNKPNKKPSTKNPENPMKPFAVPGESKSSGGKSSGSGTFTGGGMPFVAQPLAGVSSMPSMAVPPPPPPIIR